MMVNKITTAQNDMPCNCHLEVGESDGVVELWRYGAVFSGADNRTTAPSD